MKTKITFILTFHAIKPFMKKFLTITALSLSFSIFAQGSLENPANNSTESGIGIISGWHCTATKVEAFIDEKTAGFAFVGSSRGDTANVCGKTNTGYSLLFNFNELSRGSHNLKIYADGIKFGEANFNTTQSGGRAFLTNVSKQVTVSDFPSPGASATLTWSQSKQSFVVTSISAGSSTPSPTGIEKLYGSVTFNYKFNTSQTIYTDKTNFTSENLDNDGFLVNRLMNRNANIGCGSTDSTPEFLCVIDSPSGSLDMLLFDINSTGSIFGKYEYCTSGISLADCMSDLIYNPDGTTSGIIVRNSSPTRLDSNNFSKVTNTLYDHQQFENKKTVKVDNLKNDPGNVTTKIPKSEVFQKIENTFLNILGIIR